MIPGDSSLVLAVKFDSSPVVRLWLIGAPWLISSTWTFFPWKLRARMDEDEFMIVDFG